MKSAVVVFPGSNCDHDMYYALKLLGFTPEFVWHKDTDLSDFEFVTLPGGFSYGDYLRSGAIARFSPIMEEVIRFARSGRPVLGVCNGFQMLVESGLLPGALLRNEQLRFSCRYVHLQNDGSCLFTRSLQPGQILKIPIAHGDGRYYLDEAGFDTVHENEQVVFRYVSGNGADTNGANPNGSMSDIAGVTNVEGNVLGMMPHPERAVEAILGSEDGRGIFQSLLA